MESIKCEGDVVLHYDGRSYINMTLHTRRQNFPGRAIRMADPFATVPGILCSVLCALYGVSSVCCAPYLQSGIYSLLLTAATMIGYGYRMRAALIGSLGPSVLRPPTTFFWPGANPFDGAVEGNVTDRLPRLLPDWP